MYEKTILIFTIYFVVFLAIMTSGLFAFVLQYRKKKKIELLEKESIAQQHAQELLNNRLDIQQKTMEDIGRDLHDNIGQKITLASIYTQQMQHANDYSNIEDKIGNLTTLLNETLQDLRAVSKNLTNANIERNALKELLEIEVKQIEQSKKCAVQWTCSLQTDALSVNEKLVLLRIAQEFIQNSLKYSKCTEIFIAFEKINEQYCLTLKDNGIGFDVEQVQQQNRGIGLANMKRRAEIIGAQIQLKSKIGLGTSVEITV